jgi:outer membrane lipoprotein-sorting protein
MKLTGLILIFIMLLKLNAATPEEIITKAEEGIKGKTSHGIFTMNVVRPEFTRTVKMESWNDGNENALIVVLAPKREQNNKTLKRGNEMWTYLKNTELTMKLPPSMLLQSWNGSDLTNDDMLRETNLAEDYKLRLLDDEVIAGENCWQIELKPKPGTPVAWGKIRYWVRKSDYLPARIRFYDEKGRLHRTMEFSDYKVMSGKKTPAVWKIVDEKKVNQYTEFISNSVEFNIKIPSNIFSLKELEK